MRNITNNIKKAGVGLGLLILSYIPLKSQDFKSLTVKAGVTYNIVQIDGLHKNSLGIETLLEKKLKERLSTEFETGLYSDTRANTKFAYSKLQTNFGLKYKPIMKNGWTIGGKLALGVSSEFYKEIESTDIVPERIAFNKLIGLDVEKVFKNGRGINLGVSREIDRNIWRIGIKGILRTESKKQQNYSNKKSYPWPQF